MTSIFKAIQKQVPSYLGMYGRTKGTGMAFTPKARLHVPLTSQARRLVIPLSLIFHG